MVHRLIPPSHRSFACGMRADVTKAENLLWQALRNRQLEGLKFKRQVTLGGYILDFVCFEAALEFGSCGTPWMWFCCSP